MQAGCMVLLLSCAEGANERRGGRGTSTRRAHWAFATRTATAWNET